MKPRVLITRVLPEPALEVVRQACEVQLDPLDQQLTPAALQQAVVDKHGVLCLITDRIDAAVLDAATALTLVDVLEHLADPLAVSKDCVDRLRPGGAATPRRSPRQPAERHLAHA